MSIKSIWIGGSAALLFSSFLSVGFAQPASTGTVYAQLASTDDQLATFDTINQAIPIDIQSVDAISEMEWDPKNDKLTIKEDGIYFIMAVLQVGARENSTNIVKGGDIYFWLEQNGTAVADSGSWVFASPSSRAKTITSQTVMPLKQGDALRFIYSSSAPSMGLLTIAGEKNRPSSSGISVTVFKLNDSTPSASAGNVVPKSN